MRLELAIDARGLDALIDRLENVARFAGSVGDQLGDILRTDIRRQFEMGGIPRWTPLAQSTIQQKRAGGYPRLNRMGLVPQSSIQRGGFGPGNILERTMRLYSSWTDKKHLEHVSKRSDGMIEEGSSVPYADIHQKGSRDGKHPPKRPIVITDEAMRQAVSLLESAAAGGN